MKSELDHYRKFSLTDYSVNLKKFKEYLEFTRKNNLVEEKIYILENLVTQTNDKSQSGAPHITEVLDSYTSLCVLVVIFSDFEIENFFKIPNFSLNFQKTILFQAINYCLDRNPEKQQEIFYKFQFWVLKLMNKNISITGDMNPIPTISSEELNQSLDNLCKKIQTDKNSNIQNKLFLIKISYELGYYYYLNNDEKKMKEYFNYCINQINSDVNIDNNSIYFKKEQIISLLDFSQNNHFLMSEEFCDKELEQNVEMKEINLKITKTFDLQKESNLNEIDFESFLNKISIDNQAKIIIDKFCIDETKTLELFNFEELLKCSKNLIFLSFKNYHRLKDAKIYIEKVQEIINKTLSQLTNTSPENQKKELNIMRKENSYHLILITLIDCIYNKEEKLRKQFLSHLSESILKLTLTDDLEISGMIHGLIINFTQSFKSVFNYFNDFVDFFQQTSTYNQIETVNQIFFISTVLKIINYLLFSNFPTNQINNVTIEGEIHCQVFDLVFFWLSSLKENRTNKKDNILFVMIKTIKNSNYLLVFKIILLGVLKFIIDRKNISNSFNDEIFDQIFQINTNLFKIETIINENKNNAKFSNLKIQFKEEINYNYKYDPSKLEYYEMILFKLIRKIEKKIIKYGKFSEVEFLERSNNLLFFENLSQKRSIGIENNILNKNESNLSLIENINEIDSRKIITEYVKYFKIFFHDFKLKFYKNDVFENYDVINEYYTEFKNLLDEVTLLRFIYTLSTFNKNLEASILLQYTKKIDYDLAYKFLKNNIELQSINILEHIFKMVYFELLSNIYYQQGKLGYLAEVNNLIKRTSNHQYFKHHSLRKLFKIINFFKFIENISI